MNADAITSKRTAGGHAIPAAVLLAIVLAMGAALVVASHGSVAADNGDAIDAGDSDALQAAIGGLSSGESATIRLTGDSYQMDSGLHINPGVHVTIDLNGRSLDLSSQRTTIEGGLILTDSQVTAVDVNMLLYDYGASFGIAGSVVCSGSVTDYSCVAQLSGLQPGPGGLTIVSEEAFSDIGIEGDAQAGSLTCGGEWASFRIGCTVTDDVTLTFTDQTLVIFDDFVQGSSTVLYVSENGTQSTSVPDNIQLGFMGTCDVSGFSVSVGEVGLYNGEYQMPSVSVSRHPGSGPSGFITNSPDDHDTIYWDGDTYRLEENSQYADAFNYNGFTDPVDAGYYYLVYLYSQNGFHGIRCYWEIAPADVKVTVNSLSKYYDGTTALEDGAVSVNTPSNSDWYYDGLTISFAYASAEKGDQDVVMTVQPNYYGKHSNYTFTVEQWGESFTVPSSGRIVIGTGTILDGPGDVPPEGNGPDGGSSGDVLSTALIAAGVIILVAALAAALVLMRYRGQ